MKRHILIFMILCNLVLTPDLGAVTNRIVAVVNNDVILESDVNNFLSFVHMQLSATVKDKQELESQMQDIKNNALNRLIEDKLILQEALRQKIEISPERIQDMITAVKKKFSAPEDFVAALNSQGLTIADLERRFKEQLMMQDITEKEVRQKIIISPQEITAYYMGHQDEFKIPESVYLDSIVVDSQEKMNEALEQLKNGVEFTVVSQRFSKGAALGQVRRGQLRSDIEEVVFKLKPGEVSSPIITESGICIFLVKEKALEKTKTLSDAEDEIRSLLSYKKMDDAFNKWMDKLKKDAHIEVR